MHFDSKHFVSKYFSARLFIRTSTPAGGIGPLFVVEGELYQFGTAAFDLHAPNGVECELMSAGAVVADAHLPGAVELDGCDPGAANGEQA